jgi:penicillin amidase
VARETGDIIHNVIDNLKKINAYVHMGSYAWVVSGSKTADGNPIIYSGPQMGFSVPSITCEGSIKCPTLNVSGMTVPGIPMIIIGRTPHHAWSMQVGHAHTTDYYLENPLAMKKDHVEKIQVAGQGTVKVKIYRSKHGPVISPMPFDPKHVDGPCITWANSHWDHEWEALDGFLQMARATSMDQFDAGIHKVCVSQHFCYADKDGNIAYWMSGWDPVRAPGDVTMLPQPSDGMHEWTGQLKPLSTDRNNAQGYYCGWNNKSNINYDNAPNNLSYSFGPFDRAHVIDDYLKTHNDLTFDQIRDLAVNIATTDSSVGTGGVPWSQCGSYFTAAVDAYPTPARLAALSVIQSWDGHFVAGGSSQWATGMQRSDAWVLEEAWIDNVIKLTFSDELGPDAAKPSMQLFNVLLHALKGQSSGVVNYYDWFQDRAGLGLPTDPQQLIDLALDMTLNDIGLPPYNESRGVITFTHDMLGPIHTMPYSNRSTYGHCVEYGPSGVVRLESFFPLGESGFIGMGSQGQPVFDPNFFSMAPLFDTFTMRPFPAPTN